MMKNGTAMTIGSRASNLATVIGGSFGYWFVISVAITALDPGTTPPGFNPLCVLPTFLTLLAAWHLGGFARFPIFFLIFGCIPPIQVVFICMGDGNFYYGLEGHSAIYSYLTTWIIYIVGMGLATRKVALVAWDQTVASAEPRGFEVVFPAQAMIDQIKPPTGPPV
jgi:hypothetical protein